MKFNNIQEKQNKLFQRIEFKAETELDSVPSKSEVLKAVSEKYKKTEEEIEILKIIGQFGSHVFEITAEIYDSKEAKNSTVTKTKKQRETEAKVVEEAKKAEEEAKKAEEESQGDDSKEPKAAAEAQKETPVEEIKTEEGN